MILIFYYNLFSMLNAISTLCSDCMITILFDSCNIELRPQIAKIISNLINCLVTLHLDFSHQFFSSINYRPTPSWKNPQKWPPTLKNKSKVKGVLKNLFIGAIILLLYCLYGNHERSKNIPIYSDSLLKINDTFSSCKKKSSKRNYQALHCWSFTKKRKQKA